MLSSYASSIGTGIIANDYSAATALTLPDKSSTNATQPNYAVSPRWPITVQASDPQGKILFDKAGAVFVVNVTELNTNIHDGYGAGLIEMVDGIGTRTQSAGYAPIWENLGGGRIRIKRIRGLMPCRRYKVRLLIIGE
jgi:hypothetical protein